MTDAQFEEAHKARQQISRCEYFVEICHDSVPALAKLRLMSNKLDEDEAQPVVQAIERFFSDQGSELEVKFKAIGCTNPTPDAPAEPRWPRIRDLPESERAPFNRWLAGQTCPHIEGAKPGDQDGYYQHDYARWKAGLPNSD